MIRVVLADDHHLFREGLTRLLDDEADIEVVASLRSGEEVLASFATYRPDVVVLDVNMPGIDGIETARRLKEAYPNVNILLLTVSEDRETLFRAVQVGVRGYLLKSSTSDELVEAIQRVQRGEAVLSPAMSAKLLDEFVALTQGKRQRPEDVLTDRERDILRYVAQGMSNKEIGAALAISPHTVKAHLRHILDKLGLRSRAQAAAWAERHGLTGEHPRKA
ncbi:MAG TPA: response regulator transcription factor [Anaerolineae bacterium]|nr:response regulator transcription factor [Anaerolineae bacterium]